TQIMQSNVNIKAKKKEFIEVYRNIKIHTYVIVSKEEKREDSLYAKHALCILQSSRD
ncbi:unnamed protein product, partial [Ceratitis capitata]